MSGAPYAPDARRDTPLARKLVARIRATGPLSVADYMAACLNDPEFGYYRTQLPIGRDGDFITAPEISQVFGELMGLWCAIVWQQMASPSPFALVELGPGRGTMMRDMLRALSRAPDCLAAAHISLVEPSQRLRAMQADTLRSVQVPVTHLSAFAEPTLPTIIVANEVLDCLPVDQFVRVRRADGQPCWVSRLVDVDGSGHLQFRQGDAAVTQLFQTSATDQHHDIIERPQFDPISTLLGSIAANVPMVALFIDYGPMGGETGDTLQAIRNHAFEHPLTSPGEADLTAHVDFAAVTTSARAAGFAVDGPITQAEFLGRLGIMERTSRLMAANPAKANALELSTARLMQPSGMGTRFKVIAVRSPHLPSLPGF